MSDKKVIDNLLSDEFTKEIIRELGIERDSPESQAAVISSIGEVVMQRVTLEIQKRLPVSVRLQFESLLGEGDMQDFDSLLRPYIPDIDNLIATESRKEFETIKALSRERLANKDF